MKSALSPYLYALLALWLLSPHPATARGSKQGQRREQLLERLGLEKQEAPPNEPSAPPPAGDAPLAPSEDEHGDDPEPEGEKAKAKKRAPVTLSFAPRVHELLLAECRSCHRPELPAARSGFALTGDPVADYDASKRFVKATARESKLYSKAIGVAHGGGAVLSERGEGAALIAGWIADGAVKGERPPAARGAKAPSAPVAEKKPRGASEREGGALKDIAKVPERAPSPPAPDDTVAREVGAAAPPPSFADVHRLLGDSCASCHGGEGMASASRYRYSDDVDEHYRTVRSLIAIDAPQTSLLLQRAVGIEHAPVWKKDGDAARQLTAWIADGARREPSPAGEPSPTAEREAVSPPTASAAPPSSAPPPLLTPQPILDAAAQSAPWLKGLSLHGRFDLSYERRGYTNNPFADEATDALRSYHHFLFLSRRSASDPFGFTVELISLQFWEASLAHSFGWLDVAARAGKIFVPFGAEPLYHHSYGGLAGFDQRLLPVVWAQEGAAVSAAARGFGLGLSADAYVVRGHRLRAEDATLSLQADLSPDDDVKLAAGARVRFSAGPLDVYYSGYLNPLGFGRLLYLQALDVGLWRARGVPFLEDVALSVGLLRGDVSGKGAGHDHYHFGSYLQLRYYPLDFLFFQYRQGLRTFDNQRGLYVDVYRLTPEDASTHSVGMQLAWRGVGVGLWHFWNLEKVDERDDDFFRLTVSYAF